MTQMLFFHKTFSLSILIHWAILCCLEILRNAINTTFLKTHLLNSVPVLSPYPPRRKGAKFFFLSIWVLSHQFSRFTEQQEMGQTISLTSLYHSHPLRRHLDISREITAEWPNPNIANSQTRIEKLWLPSASR